MAKRKAGSRGATPSDPMPANPAHQGPWFAAEVCTTPVLNALRRLSAAHDRCERLEEILDSGFLKPGFLDALRHEWDAAKHFKPPIRLNEWPWSDLKESSSSFDPEEAQALAEYAHSIFGEMSATFSIDLTQARIDAAKTLYPKCRKLVVRTAQLVGFPDYEKLVGNDQHTADAWSALEQAFRQFNQQKTSAIANEHERVLQIQQAASSGSTHIVEVSPQQNPKAWPPDDKWHFRPGGAAFAGIAFKIKGTSWSLLKTLAEARGPVNWGQLADSLPSETTHGLGTIRSYVSTVRSVLREEFKCGKSTDPIPVVAWGSDRTAWQLDSDALLSAAQKQR